MHASIKGLTVGGFIVATTLFIDEIDAIPAFAASSEQHETKSSPTQVASQTAYQVARADYSIPAVSLIDSNDQTIELNAFLDQEGPVLLQFVFATCSTICPILSASFASAQAELNALSAGGHRLVSISIDPEQDTPERLRAYGQRFKAGAHWHFLTGKEQDVQVVLKAFDANYTGSNKMFHRSLTFMRAKPGDSWQRIEGMLSKNALLKEYRHMLVSSE